MASWDGFPDHYLDAKNPSSHPAPAKKPVALDDYPDSVPPAVVRSSIPPLDDYPDAYSSVAASRALRPPAFVYDDVSALAYPALNPSPKTKKASLPDDYPDAYAPSPPPKRTVPSLIGGYPDLYLEPSLPKKPTFPYGYPDIYLDTFLPSQNRSVRPPSFHPYDDPDVYLSPSQIAKTPSLRFDDYPNSAYSPPPSAINASSSAPRISRFSIDDHLDAVYLGSQTSVKNCCKNCIEDKPCCSSTKNCNTEASCINYQIYDNINGIHSLNSNKLYPDQLEKFPQLPSQGTWVPILAFSSDPNYTVGIQYGRAVGSIDIFGSRCQGGTGWLLNNNIVISAEHILRKAEIEPRETVVSFGEYDDPFKQTSRTGTSDAKNRLIDLGIPEQIVSKMGTSIRKFDIRSVEIDVPYDTEYFVVKPNEIEYTIGNKKDKVLILPGYVYGYIPILISERIRNILVNREVYGLSYNRTSKLPCQILLSPGGRNDGGIFNFFSVSNISTAIGSSGGVIIDKGTNKAIGVISKASGRSDGYGVYSRLSEVAYLTEKAYDYTSDNVPAISLGSITNKNNVKINTRWVGGTGGTRKSFICPDGYAVSGVTGSNLDDFLGNLGIICLPFNKSESYQLKNSMVFLTGSKKIPEQVGKPFNSFINENSYIENNTIQQQPFSMCAPGYYLSGLSAYIDQNNPLNLIMQIPMALCRRWDNSSFYYRIFRIPLGNPDHGFLREQYYTEKYGIKTQWATCPNEGIVTGIDIHSGWYVDGFQLKCTEIIK